MKAASVRLLVVLALLLVPASASLLPEGGVHCRGDQFRCRDRRCVPLVTDCSGNAQCADVSDARAATCRAYTQYFDMADRWAVGVTFDARFSSVAFLICPGDGHDRCQGFETVGEDAAGNMRFRGYSGCLYSSWRLNCTTMTIAGSPPGWRPYADSQRLTWTAHRNRTVIALQSTTSMTTSPQSGSSSSSSNSSRATPTVYLGAPEAVMKILVRPGLWVAPMDASFFDLSPL